MEQYINKIINADCVDILKRLPDKCIDCFFSDIPYRISQGGCSTTSSFGTKNKWQNNPEKLELYKKGKIFTENNIEPSEYLPDVYRIMKAKQLRKITRNVLPKPKDVI